MQVPPGRTPYKAKTIGWCMRTTEKRLWGKGDGEGSGVERGLAPVQGHCKCEIDLNLASGDAQGRGRRARKAL